MAADLALWPCGAVSCSATKAYYRLPVGDTSLYTGKGGGGDSSHGLFVTRPS
jgi:hypothetical protein